MYRRTLLGTVAALVAASAGCSGGCRGVSLGLELTPAETDQYDRSPLDLDSANLSRAEQEAFERATEERVDGCTRDDISGLQAAVERIADHDGIGHDIYHSRGATSTLGRFDETGHRARICYETAE